MILFYHSVLCPCPLCFNQLLNPIWHWLVTVQPSFFDDFILMPDMDDGHFQHSNIWCLWAAVSCRFFHFHDFFWNVYLQNMPHVFDRVHVRGVCWPVKHWNRVICEELRRFFWSMTWSIVMHVNEVFPIRIRTMQSRLVYFKRKPFRNFWDEDIFDHLNISIRVHVSFYKMDFSDTFSRNCWPDHDLLVGFEPLHNVIFMVLLWRLSECSSW